MDQRSCPHGFQLWCIRVLSPSNNSAFSTPSGVFGSLVGINLKNAENRVSNAIVSERHHYLDLSLLVAVERVGYHLQF